jgi:predicted kinase
VFEPATRDRVIRETRAALDRHASLLDARRQAGLVRLCHGDLHLRNLCLVEGRPTLFDAVEFNEDISCIDVLYDFAFLLMDLWRRDLRLHGNIVFNAYLAQTVDLTGLPLLPLFLSCRAAVRAKTSVTAAAVQGEAGRAREMAAAAREYLDLALRLLQPSPPRLVAIGGFSGSGKSTLGRALGPGVGAPPGALILRSDAIRKALFGVAPTTRLGPEAYSPAVSRTVYRTLAERALTALQAGHAVIADAVYAMPDERAEVAAVARQAGVPFRGVWIDGPDSVFAERLRTRVGDVSDATPEVLQLQRRVDVGPIDWRRLDGSLDAASVQRRAEEYLAER